MTVTVRDLQTLLIKTAEALRLADKQTKEQRLELDKLAAEKRARGIVLKMDVDSLGDTSIEEKVAAVLASGQDLDVLEKAVELRARDPKLASVAPESDAMDMSYEVDMDEYPAGQARRQFLQYLSSGHGSY